MSKLQNLQISNIAEISNKWKSELKKSKTNNNKKKTNWWTT
jgi:hypothetical protein